jgi:hypothetical protein
MSKQNDLTDELNFSDELSLEPAVEQGPVPAIAPTVGNSQKVMQHFSHCNICGGRLHFNYISDFSRNTTQEKAVCPECGLDSRQVLHRLQ